MEHLPPIVRGTAIDVADAVLAERYEEKGGASTKDRSRRPMTMDRSPRGMLPMTSTACRSSRREKELPLPLAG